MMVLNKFLRPQKNQENGFTLVELMIALAISGIVTTAIITAFVSQKTSSVTQTKISIMQQNLRSTANHMSREIRMSQYDVVTDAGGISLATPTNIIFTREIDALGTLQTIQYSLINPNGNPFDPDGDGDSDIGIAYDGAGLTLLAENIEALELLYFDADGNQTANVNAITMVQISILARADTPDQNFFNSTSYFPASCPQAPPPAPLNDACIVIGSAWDFDGAADNRNAFDDQRRRRLLVTTVQLRN